MPTVRLPTDQTLYDLRNKQDQLEPLPAGNWALNEEPLLVGDEIRLGTEPGFTTLCRVRHDGYEWYAEDALGNEYPLRSGMHALRVGAPR